MKEFKEEIFEGGFASYYVGYEDGWDAVEKLYPNLNLSSIVPPAAKDEIAKEDATPTRDRTLTAPEVIQVLDATPKQRDEDGN